MRLLKFSFLLLIISCAPQRDKILIPAVGSDFYDQALVKINEDLSGDENNLHLVEQKLYYCDYLGWPGTCIEALDEFKRQKGMTPQLLDQYAHYYVRHDQYEPLLSIMNRWAQEFESDNSYLRYQILASAKLGLRNQATDLLRHYMIDKTAIEDVRFAAERHIELADTLMASYYLGKLMKLNAGDELIYENYAMMLFELGFEEKAFEILEQYSELNPTDYEFHYTLANRYKRVGENAKARRSLQEFADSDSIIYEIADLYLADVQWDSAHLYIDKIIERDSLDKNAWTKKAMMYERRGWLNYSLNYFNHVLYLHPEDSIARTRALQVQRKIAYLQRKKFEENQLPLPVIQSKKIINNE